MYEAFDVANAFSTQLKLAWVAWLAWGIGQAFWYKLERATAAKPKRASAVRAPRKPAAKSHKVEPAIGRLITPARVDATALVGTPRAAAPVVPPAPPASPAPAFDPAKAVVETFDARNHEGLRAHGELDAIVADMEAHMPRGHGVDAPHVH